MQNRTGWNQPANVNGQSQRLRSSRPMPAWMQVSRGGPPPPPPPPDEQPVDPDYEVIDFGNNAQIYSNTPAPSGSKQSGKRCDLCGSSAPAVRCVQCSQNFCLSCDHMYHRHPKRQAHIRKELQDSKIRPPLPPKGESAPAPVPPPRRNKTGRPPPARPAAPPLQRDQEVKSAAVLNSLKRSLPSRPMPNPPFPSMQNGMQASPHQSVPSPLGPLMTPHKHQGNMGASEWDVNHRSRAGSFSNPTSPGFSSMMHAQSMAQLNSPCPSCHFHGQTPPPMSPWGNVDPWGNWGAMPPWQSQNFLNQPSGRVGSRRGSMRRRRQTSSGSDEEDDRMSRRGGNRRGVSPTPSRRSRAPPSDYESEEEEGGWEARRGGTLSRRASLVDVNRSPNRRERDDDTMSVSGRRFSHATMSRAQKDRRYEDDQSVRNRRNTIEKIPYADSDRMIPRGHRISDSDESPRETSSSLRRESSRRSEKLSDSGRRRASPARSYYNENPSDSPYDEEIPRARSLRNQEPERKEQVEPEAIEDTQNSIEPEEEPETEWDPVPEFDWECEHCTFVNSPGTRVCIVCCKTNPKPKKHVEAPVTKMTEQMKSITLERTGSRRINQDRYQDRQKQNGMHDERVQETPRLKQEAFGDRQLRHQDSYNAKKQTEREQDRELYDDRIQERSYKKPESDQELHQRQKSVVSRQESFNSKRTERDDRFQDRVRTPEKHARGTSPMTSKRAQEPIRMPDSRSPGVRTPDTKTSDSSSYSSRNVTSKGTSPPPQSISTQTYEAPVKLKRATSLADYSEWRAPQRTYSRQSLLSDTQSLPVTPPKGRSPERFPDLAVADTRREPEPLQPRRRAGSQPPEYISTLVQKQVKQGLEMVKLLREAEEQKFSADDLAVALLHCEDGDPVSWLQQNWRNMIDTVVTLATNYGHERKENTVGTISAAEARDALRMHDGNVWAAVTECVEQRQKKYAELLSRGNFSREDIVTVLTTNHGNLEAAYTELSKSQLKPFLMKIWGPPQGVDNDSGNFTKLAHDELKGAGRGGVDQEEVSFNNFNRDRVQTWIDNSVPRSKLSQSMLHLNLIGSNKTIEKLEALSNLSKTEKRDLRARRTSDVHRYLTQLYTHNDNSLKISKSFTSMQDVNKPKKENTNTLWKFLEKNIGFASSGTLLTVSTTSSNVQAKSVGTDFDTDSLNEDGSGDGEMSERSDVREKLSQVSDVKMEIEKVHDDGGSNDEDEGVNEEETGEKLAGNRETTVSPTVMEDQRIEDSSSPVRQIFVKSITVSSGGSTRSVSPQKEQNPETTEESTESTSSGTGSFESVDEDSGENYEVDMNLDRNSEPKDVAVMGKLILEEEMSPGPTSYEAVPINEGFENTKRQEITVQQGVGNDVIDQFAPENDNPENEEEILQMVENLIQKTEFMQEGHSAEANNSISVMYTNQELGVSSLSLKKSNSPSPVTVPEDDNTLPQTTERKTSTDGEGERDKVEEVVKKGEDNEPSDEKRGANKVEVDEANGGHEGTNGGLVSDGDKKLPTENEEIDENKTEEPFEEPLDVDTQYEVAVNDGDKGITEVLANPVVKTENVENFIDVTKEIINGNDARLETPLEKVSEDGLLEDNTENEIYEEPPETMVDTSIGENIMDLDVEGGPDHATDIPAMDRDNEQDDGARVGVEPGELNNNEEAQPVNVESSSGTPQTALNMAETDSKSIATNLLHMSEGNSERDVSPIPTDSEKDPGSRLQQEGHKLSRAKSSYELSVGDVIENNAKLTRTASSNELVNLLRESLAKDDVVERIVSTLFQSVLRANEFQLPSHSRDPSLLRSKHGSSLSRNISFRGTSESERDDSELYYEAVETREFLQDRRGRRQLRRRGRNSRRRGTPRKTDESSIISTSTDNYSNRDGNSSSTSPADIVDYIDETEREARRLLAEGVVASYDQAELVVQLKALNFSQEDSLLAAKECSSVDAAIAFLQQECDLCAGKYCMKQMVSMLECEHACCRECAQNYFTLQITERSVGDCVCPFCKEPDIGRMEEDAALDYFGHLDIFLKALVAENTHELFQRKLRDRTLMSDPNFKWCIKCSSGFIANPKQRKLICPDCRTITCAHCRKAWEKEHEKMTCEEFAAFKNEGDAEENQVEKQLAEGGVTCPKCHQRYLLAKGGCMHLTCPGCKHEFCSGCAKPFLMGAKCAVSPNCERLGLHSHHPRNCLFYLRDKDPPVLEQLLQEHGIELAKESEPSSSKCKTQLLKETTDGLVEASCGHPVEGAGLCRSHYIEHLVDLVKINKIDPVGVMDATDAVQELRRHGKDLPIRADFPSDKEYLNFCTKIISQEIPLE